jgi:hypothetical protein
MTAAEARPFCAEVSAEQGEPVTATASRVEHWLLIEYGGYWPHEPLDAAVFAGSLREHLAAQLASLRYARLLLVKRAGRGREDRVRVLYGATPERGSRFYRLELEGHPDLLDLEIGPALRGEAPPPGEPLDHPLLLVCTHGIRDRCCARYGQALNREVRRRADPDWVWQSTHVGGDRFAGNLVALPEGLYFGRVGRVDAAPLLDSYLAGRIEPSRYRGRSCYAFPVQAAEARVRETAGLSGFHDLRLLATRSTAPDAWTVEFLAEVAGTVHEVDVGIELGEPTFLTCKSEAPRPPRRFVVRGHRERAAQLAS